MQAGAQMVKLRGSSKGLVRFYFLDEHRSCVRWRPSRKSEKAKSECAGLATPGGHARTLRGRVGTGWGQSLAKTCVVRSGRGEG